LYPFLNSLIQLARANLAAVSHFVLDPEVPERERLAEFWRESIENQAQFTEDCIQGWMKVLARQRTLVDGQFSRLSDDAERVAAEVARTAVRAVGIATQARRGKRDRRIFSLPLPVDRRQSVRADRRGLLPGKVAEQERPAL
jgi:hypothetical protein